MAAEESSRQVFVPSNNLTNTFIFDTVSFMSILTLMVFIVRVFNRVVRSNTVQTVEVGSDPSLGRQLWQSSREEREELWSSLDRRKREVGQTGTARQIQGIAGVDYDTIYLAIGVAATALFIIETLYKAYQVYVSAGGRQFSEDDYSSPGIM